VQIVLRKDASSGHLLVFRDRRGHRIKLLRLDAEDSGGSPR
jgi:hypothetical protein